MFKVGNEITRFDNDVSYTVPMAIYFCRGAWRRGGGLSKNLKLPSTCAPVRWRHFDVNIAGVGGNICRRYNYLDVCVMLEL